MIEERRGGGFDGTDKQAACPYVRPPQASSLKPVACSLRPVVSPRGITLLELLIVVVILLALTAASIPVLMPALEGRRVKEASRLLTSYIAGARDRALHNGRPVGIMLERFPGLPEACITISEVEVPPPYAGDLVTSTFPLLITNITVDPAIEASGVLNAVGTVELDGPPALPPDLNLSLLRVGDVMRFGYRGPDYTIVDKDGDDTNNVIDNIGDFGIVVEVPVYKLGPNNWRTNALPWEDQRDGGTLSLQLPYQIFRNPVKTARPPLELPQGMVVDLVYSGEAGELFGPTDVNDLRPVIILFGAAGGLSRLYHSEPADEGGGYDIHRPDTPVHLLLGYNDKVPGEEATNPSPENNNLLDLTSIWVSIIPSTGLIASTENAFVATGPADLQTIAGDPDIRSGKVVPFRQYALEGQSMGER